MAVTKAKPPRNGTPYGQEVEQWIDEIYKRTGGDTDSVDGANVSATAAQASADASQVAADAAQAAANAAQTTADTAVANAATAQAAAVAAQATANSFSLQYQIEDVDADGSSSADGRMNIICPFAGTITKISIIPNSAVSTETDVNTYIDGTIITGGEVTIASSSAQGAITSTTPSGANTVSVGSRIASASDGAAGAACRASVLLYITRT